MRAPAKTARWRGRARRHVGGYDNLGDSWCALAMWEVYVTEPIPDADPATLRTDLSWVLAE